MRSRPEEGTVKDRKQLWFLTSNSGKFREAAAIAAASGLRLRMLAAKKIEIQSESLRRIASYAAQEAANRLVIPVVAEDAGLFVDALHGFPGPYSSDVFKRLGIEGILKLMENIQGRKARFYSSVAYCAPHKKPKCFTGTVDGVIGLRPRGSGGFGFDPIFIPTEGDGRTFSQMNVREKNKISHRAASFRKLSRWLLTTRGEP
jgi:XTP/dITP diphosphohydrolase